MKKMTKNNIYWQKRMVILKKAQLNKSHSFFEDLDRLFSITNKKIDDEINAWYQRFAKNNNISMAEARRLLNTKELEEFKWDVKEYIKYGEENAINQQWMKELENASARVHISRLESLKLQMQQHVEALYGNFQDGLDKLLRKIYTEDYYHTAYEIQKGFKIGWSLHSINDRQFDMIISKPWTADGRTFSDRIWTHKNELINTLQTGLTQSVIRGEPPDKLIKSIAKQFDVSKFKAGRLVMTESAAFSAMAQKDCFNDLGVEEYEIVATLDNRTSEICRELDGKVIDMKDYEVGVTAPPFHVYCRTVTVPYFDDSFGERAAKDANGKTYYVPANITYKEWKKRFIIDAATEKDKELYIKYKSILGLNSPDDIENFLKIRYNEKEWELFKAYAKSIQSGELTPLADFNTYKDISDKIDSILIGTTTANGIKIKSKSNHYIARSIGSVEQKRNGVKPEDALQALTNPVEIYPVKTLKNGKSQRFRGSNCIVTINPDTGNLIQVNPYSKGR